MATNKKGGFLKGILFGGAVASAVSLLYAPKSGKRMRRDIRKKSKKMIRDAEATLDSAQKKAENIIDETEKRIETVRKNAENAVETFRDKTDDLIEESQGIWKKERKRIKDAIDTAGNSFKK